MLAKAKENAGNAERARAFRENSEAHQQGDRPTVSLAEQDRRRNSMKALRSSCSPCRSHEMLKEQLPKTAPSHPNGEPGCVVRTAVRMREGVKIIPDSTGSSISRRGVASTMLRMAEGADILRHDS